MNSKREQWKDWIKKMKTEGYSKEDMKKNLKEKGYSDNIIDKVLKFEGTDSKRGVYLIILIFVIVFGSILLISSFQKTTPTIKTPQSIFTEIGFSGITADTITEEEKIQLLETLENYFNEQCLDMTSVPSNTCYPFVIYSYIETKKQLGISQEELHTPTSSKALNLWKEHYEKAEFNQEGYIVGKDRTRIYNSLMQFYYFMILRPESEKDLWSEKVSGVSPTNINMRFYLLKIYWNLFKVPSISLVPEDMITQEDIKNLCDIKQSIEDEWDVCEVLYYFKVRDFCETGITSQEISIAQQKLDIETQDPSLQVCQTELQKMIS